MFLIKEKRRVFGCLQTNANVRIYRKKFTVQIVQRVPHLFIFSKKAVPPFSFDFRNNYEIEWHEIYFLQFINRINELIIYIKLQSLSKPIGVSTYINIIHSFITKWTLFNVIHWKRTDIILKPNRHSIWLFEQIPQLWAYLELYVQVPSNHIQHWQRT